MPYTVCAFSSNVCFFHNFKGTAYSSQGPVQPYASPMSNHVTSTPYQPTQPSQAHAPMQLPSNVQMFPSQQQVQQPPMSYQQQQQLFSNHSAVKREQTIFILNIIRRRQGSGIGISFNDSWTRYTRAMLKYNHLQDNRTITTKYPRT